MGLASIEIEDAQELGENFKESVKRGYFVHSNGKFNHFWIDIKVLNEKLMTDARSSFKVALRSSIGQMRAKEKEIDTIVLAATGTLGRQGLKFLLFDISKDLGLTYARITHEFKIEGQHGNNGLMLTDISIHESSLIQSINAIRSHKIRLLGVIAVVHYGSPTDQYNGCPYLYLLRFDDESPCIQPCTIK